MEPNMSRQPQPPQPADDASTLEGKPAAARPGEMWGWANWRAWKAGRPALGAAEYTLHTDDPLLFGEVTEGLGPYQLFTTGMSLSPRPPQVVPAVVLRVEHHIREILDRDPHLSALLPSGDRRDPYSPRHRGPRNVDAYHGGDVADELASLISLALGIRVDNGGRTRLFEADGDPRGRPIFNQYRSPRLVPGTLFLLTPMNTPSELHARSHLATCIPWLQRYFRLERGQANALVRAARSYQAALWAVDGDPRQGWLKLISAVEAAAHHWASGEASPVEQLRAVEPELVDRLQAAGGGLLEAVAERFSPGLQPTVRMIRFTLEFLPPPPEPRPAVNALAWSKKKMRGYLSTIYGARSKDLHAGVAVPGPMCEPPRAVAAEQPDELNWRSATSETPSGVWTAKGATSAWNAEDTPMLLHTFEYIVRNALQNWWESMDSAADHGDVRAVAAPPAGDDP